MYIQDCMPDFSLYHYIKKGSEVGEHSSLDNR